MSYRFTFRSYNRRPRAGGGPAAVDTIISELHGHKVREEKHPAVYILADRYRGTLYIGVTSALWNRISAHKTEVFEGFTKRHGLKILVWYEHHHSMEDAIRREKQLKKWNRAWKIRIIEEMNRDWFDFHDNIDATATLVEPKAGPPPARG